VKFFIENLDVVASDMFVNSKILAPAWYRAAALSLKNMSCHS